MAIVHDAFLFEEQRFAARLVHLLNGSEPWFVAYEPLREQALTAFRNTPFVRLLADRYGAWDEDSLLSEPSSGTEANAQDYVLWLSLLLFETLAARQTTVQMGLGHRWQEVEPILTSKGWGEPRALAAIHGHSFLALMVSGLFPRSVPLCRSDLRCLLAEFKPVSTASSAGWLSYDDVVALHARLSSYYNELEASATSVLLKQYDYMLAMALTHRMGLCLVTSG